MKKLLFILILALICNFSAAYKLGEKIEKRKLQTKELKIENQKLKNNYKTNH